MIRTLKTISLALLLVLLATGPALPVIPPWEIEGLKDKPAPSFEAADLAGKKHDLTKYRGRAVLINFWATWCAPCRREMPALVKLYQRYKDKGLVILAVSVDEQKKAIEIFTRKLPLPFPVISDPEEKISSRYKVFAFPTSFLINKKGQIKKIITGERDWLTPDFTAEIEKLLRKKTR